MIDKQKWFRAACDRAEENLAQARKTVETHKHDEPQIGFLYIREGNPPFWLVVYAHARSKFCVPLWDRPALEYEHPKIWANDEDVCIGLPVEGYGEAVLNYNQADWFEDAKIKTWLLVNVFDEEIVRDTYRQWLRYTIE